MNVLRSASILMFTVILAACASPESRIRKHQAEFNTYPPEIQQKIRAGQVSVGFTEQQAALALGRPDLIYTRETQGAKQEVWAYGGGGRGPRVGVGFGIGAGAGPAYYNGGVAVANEPDLDLGERVRVVFQNGVVVAVESRRK